MPVKNICHQYARDVLLPGTSKEGQHRLRASHVLVAGLGTLGTFSSIYLCTAGIGHLTIVDSRTVTRENLKRQVLYTEKDVGRKKVLVARKRLSAMNFDVEINPVHLEMNHNNVFEILEGVHIIVDGTDNFKTRFLLNEACQEHGLPYVYGGVFGCKGAVMTIIPGQTPCLACLLPKNDMHHSTVPAVGPCVGLVASIQAMEVINLILHSDASLAGRLMVVDANRARFRKYEIKKRMSCRVCTDLGSS